MSLTLITSGESHGPGLTVILQGLPAGIKVDIARINHELSRRQQGKGSGPRMKMEKDEVQVLGGVMENFTTGAPLALFITNRNHKEWKNRLVEPFTTPRPGHADLTGAVKYGFDDLRPVLERASARETAARVAAGAVCKIFLEEFSIKIGGYVVSIEKAQANPEGIPFLERFINAENSEMRCPDPLSEKGMLERIEWCIQKRETLGGVIEAAALNLPLGLGSYSSWEKRLDSRLAAAIMSIPAIKGVEIGPAFENTRLAGSQAQDAIHLKGRQLVRLGEHSGGIEGGMTNGQPLILRAAMKPIPSTLTPQQTVDLLSGEETQTAYVRSDFCPVPRAVPVVEAMLAFVLADALLEKTGGDSLSEIKNRVNNLPKLSLDDLQINPNSHPYWSNEERLD